MAFILDQRLEDSSFFIEDWNLCTVRLKNDKTYPWLYLVPKRENIREIFDLDAGQQAVLVGEISTAAKSLNALYSPAKINTAALGNMVPQMHVHIFARFENDPAWPKPVWAIQTNEIPYTEDEKNTELQKLKSWFERMRKEGEPI